MPSITLPWLDDGKNVELGPVPLAGHRELQDLANRSAGAEAARINAMVVLMMNYVYATAESRKQFGSKKARKMWNSKMKERGLNPLAWGAKDFDENLDVWIEKRLMEPLGVDSYDDIKDALEAKNVEVNEEFMAHREDLGRFDDEATVVELYWRILGSSAQNITLPDEAPIKFNRGRPAREEMRQLITECASKEDLGAIRLALSPKNDRPLDDEFFELTDAGAVRGKSGQPADPSTKSSGDSPPSSEPTTAEETT